MCCCCPLSPASLPTKMRCASRRARCSTLRCDETVVQDHVGLLQQLQRAQGEEVRVAGTGADQVDLAERGGGARADEACGVQLAVERGARAGLIAGQHARGDGTLRHALPERRGAPTRAGPAARARAARP